MSDETETIAGAEGAAAGSPITLIIGNRNYSSWSLRAWLALKWTRGPFEVIRIPLGDGFDAAVRQHSPVGLVPVLKRDGLAIWDSLAICETLNEWFPDAELWPHDSDHRALARSLCAEMHSGFPAVRAHMSMNIRDSFPGKGREAGVENDIRRIMEIFESQRSAFAYAGDFLFGPRTIADAMYAPVVSRMHTYGVDPKDFGAGSAAADYMESVLNLDAMKEWSEAARAESETIEKYHPA